MNNPTPDTLFTTPQRQSPAAMFIILVKTAGQLLKVLWPALIVMLFRQSDESGASRRGDSFAYIIIGFAAISLIATVFKFFFYRFYIDGVNFVVKSGWLQKKVTSIPLQNIIAVHLEQHILHQVFGVAKVKMDSAGSDKIEVSIDALSLKKADKLRQVLLSHTLQTATGDTVSEGHAPQPQAPPASTVTIRDLLMLSITANHIEAFFILLALSMNAWNEIQQAFKIDDSKWIEEHASTLQNSVAMAVGLTIAVALLSVAYSFVRTFLRFYAFRIVTEAKGWRMAHGLTNHQQRFLPYNKLQVLVWHSNFIRRKFDIWIMDFKSANYSELKRKEKVHVPVFGFAKAEALAGHYQQSPVFDPAKGLHIHGSYWIRGLIYMGIIFGLVPAAVAFIWLGWWALIWMAVMGYAVVHRYFVYRHFRWWANEEGLQMYSGAWGRKFTLLTWNKVQQVHLSQNLFQRGRGVASVEFVTAGGQVVLPYIPVADARFIIDQVLYTIEAKNKPWM